LKETKNKAFKVIQGFSATKPLILFGFMGKNTVESILIGSEKRFFRGVFAKNSQKLGMLF